MFGRIACTIAGYSVELSGILIVIILGGAGIVLWLRIDFMILQQYMRIH